MSTTDDLKIWIHTSEEREYKDHSTNQILGAAITPRYNNIHNTCYDLRSHHVTNPVLPRKYS